MARPREGLLVAAFAAIAVLVGGNAVGIRFSNRELDLLWGAGLRFALAATVLVAAMVVLKLKLPRGRALTGALLFGLLGVGGALGPWLLRARRTVHAGFGSILLALVTLATLLPPPPRRGAVRPGRGPGPPCRGLPVRRHEG